AGEILDDLVDRRDVVVPSAGRGHPAHALLRLAFFADGARHFLRLVADGLHHRDHLVERLADLPVEAAQVLAHLDVEISALELAQRGEQFAVMELFGSGLHRPVTPALRLVAVAVPVAVTVLAGFEGIHDSSGVPYSARMIFSALAGLTMWASKPACMAFWRSTAWP